MLTDAALDQVASGFMSDMVQQAIKQAGQATGDNLQQAIRDIRG